MGMILALMLTSASCRNDTAGGPNDQPSPHIASSAAEDSPSPRQAPVSAATAGIAAAVSTTPTADAEQTAAAAPKTTARAKKGQPLGGGCEMCHVDVEDELVTSVHYTDGVGCVKCHGPSEGHSADENNDVKPDHVYGPDQIDAFCGSCHECSRPRVAASAEAPQPKRKICTECHQTHSLAPLSE